MTSIFILNNALRAIQEFSGAVYYGTGVVTTAKLGSVEFLQATEALHDMSAWLYFYGPLTILYLLKVARRIGLIRALVWLVKKLKQLFTRHR